MPRRKKKKKLFYFGLKNNGKHSIQEEINLEKKQRDESKSIAKKEKENLEKQNKIEEKQKKKEEKERIKRIENKNKEIRKIKKRETKEELKNNKFTNRKNDNEVFNFDNEIVLGINNNIIKKVNKKKTSRKSKKITNKSKKNKKISLFIKCTSLISMMIIISLIIMTSEVFNITEIIVDGNVQVGEELIIEFSKAKIGQNIFKTNIKEIASNIKNNTYIKSVEVDRILPTKLKITVTERVATYMLECSENYIYIDNQGYLLELSNQTLNIPIISGFDDSGEELLSIKRLNSKDLAKLNDILKITEMSKSYNMFENINKLSIEKNKDYVIYMENIGKKVYIGDTTDLNNKMLHLKKILDETQGKNGNIYINGNLNEGFKPYFSENM